MSRPRIVVLTMMTKMPVAGVVWQTVHYLAGFERLGYECWCVEAHGVNPSMFQADDHDNGSRAAAAFVASTVERFGIEDRWAYHALHDDGSVWGMSEGELRRLYRSAALIVNLHGGTTPLDEHADTGRLVYLETDPGGVQVELAHGHASTTEFLDRHCAFFTFGESYGRPGCGLPVSDRFTFHPTRQPVVLDFWEGLGPQGRTFTTIGSWRQRGRDVHLDGRDYHWTKDREFRRVIDLPARTGQQLELALARYNDADEARLTAHGWRVIPASSVSSDPDTYRSYIGTSIGEFTAAKDRNVRLRTGWFSDRSATYLAAGRPVVAQDTAFGDHLPVGDGLFAYRTQEEAAEAVLEVAADPVRHGRAARLIARDHFDSDLVLKHLLAEVGV